ncbi:hypothetical protein ACFX12_013617 [Malus domestica]
MDVCHNTCLRLMKLRSNAIASGKAANGNVAYRIGNGEAVTSMGGGGDLDRVQAREMGRVTKQSLGPGIVLNIGAMRRCSEAQLHPCKFLNPSSKFI